MAHTEPVSVRNAGRAASDETGMGSASPGRVLTGRPWPLFSFPGGTAKQAVPRWTSRGSTRTTAVPSFDARPRACDRTMGAKTKWSRQFPWGQRAASVGWAVRWAGRRSGSVWVPCWPLPAGSWLRSDGSGTGSPTVSPVPSTVKRVQRWFIPGETWCEPVTPRCTPAAAWHERWTTPYSSSEVSSTFNAGPSWRAAAPTFLTQGMCADLTFVEPHMEKRNSAVVLAQASALRVATSRRWRRGRMSHTRPAAPARAGLGAVTTRFAPQCLSLSPRT